MLKQVQITCLFAYLKKKIFHYTMFAVECYLQLQIYKNGHFQLEYGSTFI